MTQIEAKALELFPDADPRADFYQEYQRETELERAAFIKGCQYAANGSLPMTREECKEWIEKKYEESGNFTWNASTLCLTLYDHLASLSPAQPGYSEQQVIEAMRMARISHTPNPYPKYAFNEIISLLNKQP